ncbi:hypothetical protein HN51_035658 [Arachis hypogaea]
MACWVERRCNKATKGGKTGSGTMQRVQTRASGSVLKQRVLVRDELRHTTFRGSAEWKPSLRSMQRDHRELEGATHGGGAGPGNESRGVVGELYGL